MDNKDQGISPAEATNEPLNQQNEPATEAGQAGQVVELPKQTDQPQKPKRKRIIITAIVVAVLALFVGGAGAAYYAYYLPNTPENVVKQALANELTDQSLKDSAKLSGKISISGGDKSQNISLTFGVAKTSSGDASLNVKAYGVSADVVSKSGESIYIKVAGLKGLDALLEQYEKSLPVGEYETMIKSLAPVISKLDGQWYQIDSSLLGADAQVKNTLSGNLGLSQQDLDKIVDIYQENEFIVVDEKAGTAEIAGQQATEYKLHLDGPKLKGFITGLKNSKIEKLKITDDELSDINEAIDKYDLSKYPFSFWINGDKRIVRITYSHQYQDVKVEFELTIEARGEDVKIDEPSDAKNFFELLGDVQPLLEGFEDSGQDLLNQIPTELI